MREFILGVLLWLATTLFQERAGRLAVKLVHLEALLLPKVIREEMRRDWLADLATVEGNVSKFLYALKFCGNIPDIRAAYGEPLPVWRFLGLVLQAVNALYVMTFLMFLILNTMFQNQFFGLLIQMLSGGAWLALFILPIVIVGLIRTLNEAVHKRRHLAFAGWLFWLVSVMFLTGAGLGMSDYYRELGRLDEGAISANTTLLILFMWLEAKRLDAKVLAR